MSSFLTILLAIVIAASLGISLASVVGLNCYLPFIDSEYINLLPGISIASRALIAVLAFNRDKKYQSSESIRKTDETYLALARESFQEVVNLLKDQNNDRVSWIRAARMLLQTLEFRDKIQTIDIKNAYELVEESTRNELYTILTIQQEDGARREALPPQFFYGIDDWETEESLDEAAKKGGSNIVVSSVSIDKNTKEPSSRLLSKHSVIAIYNFLEYPKNYDDPLDKVDQIESWGESWSTTHGIDQGARRYVSHASKNLAIDGNLVKTDNNQINEGQD